MKKCSKCKKEKSLSEFHNNKTFKDGKSYCCKKCANEMASIAQRKRYLKDPKRFNEKHRKWVQMNHKKSCEAMRRWRGKNKEKVFKNYSVDGKIECFCKENEIAFLTIDHINGCGKELRKKQGLGAALYGWLIKNNFPKGFQILCYNCNNAKHKLGLCPHQKLIK